jgi:hypothetical protein
MRSDLQIRSRTGTMPVDRNSQDGYLPKKETK